MKDKEVQDDRKEIKRRRSEESKEAVDIKTKKDKVNKYRKVKKESTNIIGEVVLDLPKNNANNYTENIGQSVKLSSDKQIQCEMEIG